ncbi:hypothetical protein [Solicola sp. PLA-1-18]|uniref:hypothetical protein n=1 Tax=Solicola sp. PLA-1-18 TaxID=3380532 RepID=UPI003B7A0B75
MTTVSERPARRPRRRLVVLGLVVAVVAGLGTWAWQTWYPQVRIDGGADYGVGSAPARAAVTVGMGICLGGDGTARVVAVRPTSAKNGLHVRAFGVSARRDQGVGVVAQPISALPAFSGRRPVSSCTGEAGGSDLAVQVDAPRYPASTGGFEVDYEVRGVIRTVDANYGVVLYAGKTPPL